MGIEIAMEMDRDLKGWDSRILVFCAFVVRWVRVLGLRVGDGGGRWGLERGG